MDAQSAPFEPAAVGLPTRVLALAIGGSLVGIVVALGPGLAPFVDLLSLGLVSTGTVVLAVGAFGLHGTAQALMAPLRSNPGELALRHSMRFFTLCGLAAVGIGLLGTGLGAVQLLQQADDPSWLFGALSVALLTTLYGLGLGLLFLTVAAGVWRRIT